MYCGSKWAAALLVTLIASCEPSPQPSGAPVQVLPDEPAPEPEEPAHAAPVARIEAPAPTASCEIPDGPAGVRLRTLRYARGRALDLALPAGDGPHPWVVVLHGGAWAVGERAHVAEELSLLAALGYAAAGVDYRLVDDGGRHRFPTQVADARCAVRYLRRRAPELGLDPDRAAALGYSAGGHLAMMLATAADVAGLDTDCDDTATSPAIRLAISYFGPADLRGEAEYGRAAERIVNRMLGASRHRDPERAALASPIAHVDGTDAAVMLVHGTADRVVPLEQSRRMRAALAGAGVPVRLVEVEGRGHGFRLVGEASDLRVATCTSLAFLEAALRSPRGASRSGGVGGSPP